MSANRRFLKHDIKGRSTWYIAPLFGVSDKRGYTVYHPLYTSIKFFLNSNGGSPVAESQGAMLLSGSSHILLHSNHSKHHCKNAYCNCIICKSNYLSVVVRLIR